jgi:DegV family protein with EDD domain
MMIGLVVDSNSQLPAPLARRLGIAIVPMPVQVDGVDYQEGIDLNADSFYEFWSGDHSPTITTSQPSPGAFSTAYELLVESGATEILSVHVSESMSGTLNSARLAAASASVPVRLVDTNTASFGISCCALAAVDAIRDGADLEQAAADVEQRAATVGTAFIVGAPWLVENSGRADGVDVHGAAAEGIPVLAMTGGDLEILATVHSVESAVASMTNYALTRCAVDGVGGHIAVGTSDTSSRPVAEALTKALTGRSAVTDIVQYRIGPSIGAHMGPGTAGLFVF